MDEQGKLISDDMWLYGFTMVDNGVMFDGRVTDSEFRTYCVIRSMVNQKTAIAFPTYEVIAEMCNQSKRTVQRNVARLIELDLIARFPRKGSSNFYSIKKKQNSSVLMSIEDIEEWMRLNESPDDEPEETPEPDIEPPPHPQPEPEPPKDAIPYQLIMEHLNSTAGTRYNPKGEANRKLIRARYKELESMKMTPDDIIREFIHAIDVKVAQWKGGDMEKYLRPVTLFGNKFDQYRNESPNTKYTSSKSDGSDDWKTKFLEEDDE